MKDKRIRLDELKRDVPFEVPERYFDELPLMIQSRLPTTPERPPLISWSWQRSVALAGAMSLIIALVWFTFPQQQGTIGQGPLSEVSDEAILEYLHQEDISYFELSENAVIQQAFTTDSTIIHYLDGVDNEFIRLHIDEDMNVPETI
jgi:hypothetical protein